jgi:hypothetical protein
MERAANQVSTRFITGFLTILIVGAVIGIMILLGSGGMAARDSEAGRRAEGPRPDAGPPRQYRSRMPVETSGLQVMLARVTPWEPLASLDEIRALWQGVGPRSLDEIDRVLPSTGEGDPQRLDLLFTKI